MASGSFRAPVSCLVCGSSRLDILYEGVRDHAEVSPRKFPLLEGTGGGQTSRDHDGREDQGALKVGQVNFDLDYKKTDDSLEGPVSGFPPRALLREANFHRDK